MDPEGGDGGWRSKQTWRGLQEGNRTYHKSLAKLEPNLLHQMLFYYDLPPSKFSDLPSAIFGLHFDLTIEIKNTLGSCL